MVKWICDYCVVMNARWEHTRKQRRRKRNPLSTLSSHVPRGGTTPSVVEMIDFLDMALLLSITCCIKGWNVIESIGLYDTNNKPSSRPAEQPSSGGQAPLPPGLGSSASASRAAASCKMRVHALFAVQQVHGENEPGYERKGSCDSHDHVYKCPVCVHLLIDSTYMT